jgi:hypothetical protein
MGYRRGAYRVLVQYTDPREKDQMEDLSIDGWITLKWSSRGGVERKGLD